MKDACSENRISLFSDIRQRKRYLCALVMILLMIGAAELLHEKEILFPEMAALTIGMWIGPVLTVLLLFTGSLTGTVFQLVGYYYLRLPETGVAFLL